MYKEAQVPLEVDSSAILGLISSNQFMSYPQWLCHFFKGCALPLSFLSQAQEPIAQLQGSLHLNSLDLTVLKQSRPSLQSSENKEPCRNQEPLSKITVTFSHCDLRSW